VITSSVNFAKNETGSICWSIGELVSETIDSNAIILSQGFYQSNLIVTALDERINPELEISAFPNPTNDVLNVKCNNLENRLNYKITTISGELLGKGNLISKETAISFNRIPVGIYLLITTMNNQIIKSFKIEKH
jgi:hypothetical protein